MTPGREILQFLVHLHAAPSVSWADFATLRRRAYAGAQMVELIWEATQLGIDLEAILEAFGSAAYEDWLASADRDVDLVQVSA